MGTSNVDRLIVSLLSSDNPKPNIPYHQFNSLPSTTTTQTPYANNDGSHKDQISSANSGALKIEIPSSAEEFKARNDEDDPKTPRYKENKIPVTAACPPAPRKARRVPVTRKRKISGPCFPVVRVPDDFIVNMEAMLALNEAVYVPDIVVGDLGKGGGAKKLKL